MAVEFAAYGTFTGADDITEITFSNYTPVADGNLLVIVVDGEGPSNSAQNWRMAEYVPLGIDMAGPMLASYDMDIVGADRNVRVFVGTSINDPSYVRLVTDTPPAIGTTTRARLYEVSCDLGTIFPVPTEADGGTAAPGLVEVSMSAWLGGAMPSYDKEGIFFALAVEGLDDPVGDPTFETITPSPTEVASGDYHKIVIGQRPLNTSEAVSYEVTSATGGGGLLVGQFVVPQSAYTEINYEHFSTSTGIIPAPTKGNLMALVVRGTGLSLPTPPDGWESEGFQSAVSGDHWVGLFWKEAGDNEDTSLSVPGVTHMAYHEVTGYLRAPRRRQIGQGNDFTLLDPLVTANNDAFILTIASPSDTADLWMTFPEMTITNSPVGVISGSLGVDFFPYDQFPVGVLAVGVDDAQNSVTTDVAIMGFTFDDDPNVPLDANAPVAGNNSYVTPFDTALVVDAPGVLGNDTGSTLTVSAWGTPSHGTVVGNTNGSFIYTPEVGFSGADSFAYTVSNGDGQTDTGTVVITVQDATQVDQTYLFPDEGQRLLYTPGVRRGSALTSARGAEVYVYEQAEGGSLAEITDEDGDPIAGSLLVVDDDSLIPPFYGPLGVTTLWVEVAGSGVRQEVRASSADRLDKGDGGNGGVVDTRPHEMLPLTVSRHSPFTAWTQGGRFLTATPQPPIGASVAFADAALPASLPAPEGTNGWLQVPKTGDPLRLALVAIHIGDDPDMATEAHVTLDWQPFDPMIQQPVGAPIQTEEIIPLLTATEYLTLLSQGVTFENMPVNGVELTIPEYPPDTNLMLVSASMHTQEVGTGDPVTGMCINVIFSMYQGTENLIPRLAADTNLVGGISYDPHFRGLVVDEGTFLGTTKTLEIGPDGVGITDTSYDPAQEVALRISHDVPDRATWLVNGEVRGNLAATTPESFVRKAELDIALTTFPTSTVAVMEDENRVIDIAAAVADQAPGRAATYVAVIASNALSGPSVTINLPRPDESPVLFLVISSNDGNPLSAKSEWVWSTESGIVIDKTVGYLDTATPGLGILCLPIPDGLGGAIWGLGPLSPHLVPASEVTVDASGFSGNLTTDDDTAQKVAEKVDGLTISNEAKISIYFPGKQTSMERITAQFQGGAGAAFPSINWTVGWYIVPDDDCTVASARIYVGVGGSPGALLRLGLYEAVGGRPSAATLLTADVDATTPGWMDFTFAPVNITGGRLYIPAIRTNDAAVTYGYCTGPSGIDYGNDTNISKRALGNNNSPWAPWEINLLLEPDATPERPYVLWTIS